MSVSDFQNPVDPRLLEAQEAADISAINGIASLANILRRHNLLTDADAAALHESMSLPLGMAKKYADNPAVQDIQLNLDRIFAIIVSSG